MLSNKQDEFIEACKKNDTKYINKNIDSIDKEFADEQGQTPIYACMRNDSFEVADILISYGFKVNPGININPLGAAIVNNSSKAVEYLLQKGIDVNAPLDQTSNTMPIALSIHRGFNEISNILINNGADLSVTQEVQADNNDEIVDELPLISIAAQSGNLDLFEMLAENSDVNAKSKRGVLPFSFLMMNSKPDTHSFQNKAAKILIDKGAVLGPNVEDKENLISSSAITSMFPSKMSEKDRIIRENLILDVFKKGLADPFYIDISGINLLKRASTMGSIKLVMKFIELGVEVSKPDDDGFTSLHNAAFLPDSATAYKIIDELVKHPQDFDLKTNEGFTATEHAFNQINYDAAMRIIETGAKIPDNAYIKQNDQIMPLWVQLVSHMKYQDDVERIISLINKGLEIKKVNYKSYSGNKSELNILGVLLSRVILQSKLKSNKEWGGFIDENNKLHNLLDYGELINLLLSKHQEKPFSDIKIHKNTYKIQEMLGLIENKGLLNLIKK